MPAVDEDLPKLSRPYTAFEKLGVRASRAFATFCKVASLVGLVVAIVIGIPSCSVARSMPYLMAKRDLRESSSIQARLGAPLGAEIVPTRWRLEKDAADFEFRISGRSGNSGMAHVSMVAAVTTDVETNEPVRIWAYKTATFTIRARDEGKPGEVVATWSLLGSR